MTKAKIKPKQNQKKKKEPRGIFGGWYISWVPWLWWCYHECMQMSKLIKMHTLKCTFYISAIPQ